MSQASRYKIQYGDKSRFAEWSDWIDAGTPLPDSNILSLITERTMTVAEWNEYAKQYLPPRKLYRSTVLKRIEASIEASSKRGWGLVPSSDIEISAVLDMILDGGMIIVEGKPSKKGKRK